MKKSDTGVKNLNSELQLLQIKDFVDKFDNAMKKEMKRNLKKAAFITIPGTLAIAGLLLSDSKIFIFISISLMFINGIKELLEKIKEDIKEEGILFHEEPNYSTEESVEQILDKGISKKQDKDFYTDDYKILEEINENKSYDQIKYEEAIEKQNKFQVVNKEETILNKDETMEQIIYEIDTYYKSYNLSPLTITNDEWDVLFNCVYELFVRKNNESLYYDAMSKLSRYTLAKSLMDNNKEINLNSFIDNLDYIRSDIITKEDIELLKNTIKINKKSNVISLDNYKRKLTKNR